MHNPIELLLSKYKSQFKKVVPFDVEKDRLVNLDLSGNNTILTSEIFDDTSRFSQYIANELASKNATYGMGGYLENREVYSRSPIFDGIDNHPMKKRTIHLGVDIWGPSGTPVMAPWGGSIHSFAYNDRFGDYGATIILQHQIDGFSFHTLYGHLSLADLSIGQNQYISIGEQFGRFGRPEENGHWPPHLHFQLVVDMELKEGDYPGVCALNQLDYYRMNCPDPNLVLNMRQAVKEVV
ncbi:MAG: peptidoglycan DD-metalloendopeptidase family protein [Bacteroidota bacterium]